MSFSSTLPSPRLTVLLIDDNDKDRTYYAERIRMGIPDCTVLEARDGRSGLKLYQSRRIDCLITEFYLPDMPGFELLTDMVPLASKPTIAVIILTRAVTKSLYDLALQLGAQAFLIKRFTSGDELAQIIPNASARVVPTQKERQTDHRISALRQNKA